MSPQTRSFELSIPAALPITIAVLALFTLTGFVTYHAIKSHDAKALRQLELEHEKSLTLKDGEALTQNGGKLGSLQQGNVFYFYQVDATNGLRIPLPDYKVMLNAFDSTAKIVGPVVSVSPEIALYNGKMAYMGMWVTFMQKPPESLR
ncbi:MAG: hypothetical protein RLZZ347_89 [Candidatus Parcubacteria bacterium]|jgi:hypothetical protein